MSVVAVLVPIWAGIIFNVVFSCINVACLGRHGRAASGWMKFSPWLLGAIWACALAMSASVYLAE